MKHLLLITIFSCLSLTAAAQKDPVVMSIDGKPVTQTEFLQIYTKNNPNPSFDKDSLDRYMELFQIFKLKVAEAEALGYDTLPRLKKELEGYKKQIKAKILPPLPSQKMAQKIRRLLIMEVISVILLHFKWFTLLKKKHTILLLVKSLNHLGHVLVTIF